MRNSVLSVFKRKRERERERERFGIVVRKTLKLCVLDFNRRLNRQTEQKTLGIFEMSDSQYSGRLKEI